MAKINGPKQAADILNGLNPEESKKIIESLRKSDPKLLELIMSQMVRLDDLVHIDARSLLELLKEYPFKDFCIVMRLAPKEVSEHVSSLLTKGMKQELGDILSGPGFPKSQVMEKYQVLMGLLREKIQKGTLRLKGDDEDPLV